MGLADRDHPRKGRSTRNEVLLLVAVFAIFYVICVYFFHTGIPNIRRHPEYGETYMALSDAAFWAVPWALAGTVAFAIKRAFPNK